MTNSFQGRDPFYTGINKEIYSVALSKIDKGMFSQRNIFFSSINQNTLSQRLSILQKYKVAAQNRLGEMTTK